MPAYLGEHGVTLEKSSLHRRADVWRQKTIHIHIHTHRQLKVTNCPNPWFAFFWTVMSCVIWWYYRLHHMKHKIDQNDELLSLSGYSFRFVSFSSAYPGLGRGVNRLSSLKSMNECLVIVYSHIFSRSK